MATGREIVSLAETMVNYCEYQDREGFGGSHICNRSFVIHHGGSKMEVKPGYTVIISPESVVIRETKKPELNTDNGFWKFIESAAGSLLEHATASENTILWSSVSGVSRA